MGDAEKDRGGPAAASPPSPAAVPPAGPIPSLSVEAWLDDCRRWTEAWIDRLVPPVDAHPARVHEAMRYVLLGGGKRLRPALLRTLCRALGGSDAEAAVPAVALELVHTYSLVHDDLPCMDDDELRRGRPTCHVAFDEATAVLAGDALLTLAFQLLAEDGGPRAAALAASLARAAGSHGMVGGQVLDLDPRTDRGDPVASVHELHLFKTARLFAAGAEMGALAAGAEDARRERARAFGEVLGRSFQAVDDVLDVTGDAASLGKTPGKDDALERRTLVAALGLEEARRVAGELADEARRRARELGWGPGHHAHDLVAFVLTRRS